MAKRWLSLLAVVPAILALLTAPASADVVQPAAVQWFRNLYTHTCMDDSNTEHGLRVFPCNGMLYQDWGILIWPDGTRRLENQATRRCLYAGTTGLDVTTLPCNSSTRQSWWIDHVPGGIRFRNQETGYCLGAVAERIIGFTCDFIDSTTIWE